MKGVEQQQQDDSAFADEDETGGEGVESFDIEFTDHDEEFFGANKTATTLTNKTTATEFDSKKTKSIKSRKSQKTKDAKSTSSCAETKTTVTTPLLAVFGGEEDNNADAEQHSTPQQPQEQTPLASEDPLPPFVESVLNTQQREAMIKDMQEMEDMIKAWRDLSGMQTLMEQMKKSKDSPQDINDLVLSLASGIQEGSDSAVNGVLESAVVAALLVSFSIPLVVDPPDAIAELDNGDWHKLLHLIGWGALSIMAVANVLYARIYTAAMARAPRSVDKLRIGLVGNAYTEGLLMVYSMFFFIVLGLIPDVHIVYGSGSATLFILVSTIFPLWMAKVAYKYIHAGHIEYGWRFNRMKRNDPVHDMVLFETLKRRMQHGETLRAQDKPFFQFSSTHEAQTGAQGITPEGQHLLFGDGIAEFTNTKED